MSKLLFNYEAVHPTTWVYLSSLLMLGLFFKFNRFWSVRNLDLVLLILLAPGLLLVHFGERMMAQVAGLTAPEGIHGEALSDPVPLFGTLPPSTRLADLSSGAPPIGDVAGGGAPGDTGQRSGGGVTGSNAPPSGSQAADAAAATGPPRVSSDLGVSPEAPARRPGSPPADPREVGEAPEGANLGAAPPSAAESSTFVQPLSEEEENARIAFLGYLWLLVSSGIYLARLLLDPMMVRRPLLEPNLSTGGLAFLGFSLFVFLMANVVCTPSTSVDLQGPRSAERLLSGVAERTPADEIGRHGPGNALLHSIPSLVTHPIQWRDAPVGTETRFTRIAKLMAVLSNLAIVLGIVLVGYRHFGSPKMGLGAAALYLMLPYNALMAGHVDHVLPAALLVWGVLCYRQPLWAGMFIGMSIGVVYYPLFLLPLWISFYWERGLMRFLAGVAAMLVLSVGSLIFVSADLVDFLLKVRELFGIWLPKNTGLEGIWNLGWNPNYRYPFLAAFITISGAFAIWPAQKNLGTLLSCSSAVMVATQFWHGHGGGLFMAWYLPLTLLTIFRPNLEDRVALSVLVEGWFPRRKLRVANVDLAA